MNVSVAGPKLLASIAGCASLGLANALEYMQAPMETFEKWQVIVVTDDGAFVAKGLCCRDRWQDASHGRLTLNFTPLVAIHRVQCTNLIYLDAKLHPVQIKPLDVLLRAGDQLNANYTLSY